MDDPQFPEAFASLVVGLGAARRYFPVKISRRIGSLVIALILVAGSVLVFFYGLYVSYLDYQNHGLVVTEARLTGPVIIAFVLLLLAIAAGWWAYANWNKGAAIYERGLAIRCRKGLQLWSWEEIVSMTAAVTRHYTNGIYTGTTHVYTLMDLKEQRFVLSDIFFKVEELAKAIQDAIYPFLYERAAQRYNAGQMLTFGPAVISKEGFQIGKKTYPWSEVQQVSIRQGILKVSKIGGGWFSGASVPASVIPNLNVLLNLIYQVVGLKLE